MVKIISSLIAVLTLSACGLMPEKQIVYKEVKVPVFQCPTSLQTLEKVPRPKLFIHRLTPQERTDPGIVSKAYKASIKQLQNYSTELEVNYDLIDTTCEVPSLNETP